MGEKVETVTDFIFLGSKIIADSDCSHEIKRHLLLVRKAVTNLDSVWKSRNNTLPTKVHIVKAMVFPVIMYRCESWTIKKAEHQKNQCFWTVVLEKTPESPLDCKETKQDNSKGNQLWIFIGRTDAKIETPILWPPEVKSQKTNAGKDCGQDEKGTTEDEMVGRHHWLNGHKFEQTPGDSDKQASLAGCSAWGHKELDMN